MFVPGMLICSSFLISVCTFIVSKALLISSATVIVRAVGAIGCSECDVMSLYFLCCSVNVSVCLVCCVLDRVCELFGETIRDVFVCG